MSLVALEAIPLGRFLFAHEKVAIDPTGDVSSANRAPVIDAFADK